jgi:hypothetical protein
VDECYLEIVTNTQEKKLANWNVKQIGLQKKIKRNMWQKISFLHCNECLDSSFRFLKWI